MSDFESLALSDDDSSEEDSRQSYRESVGSSVARRPSIPVEDLTIEDSDNESDDELMALPKQRQKRLVVYDSEDDEEEDIERHALSPRARMSITGIRPADLSDDSSEIDDSDEEVVEQQESSIKSDENKSSSPDYQSANEEEEEESSVLEVSAEESLKEDQKSVEESEGKSPNKERNSFLEESAEASSKDGSSLQESSSVETSEDNDLASPKRDIRQLSRFNTSINSPRYSTHFANAIQDKLSSTIYQPNVEAIVDEKSSSGESGSSDVLVLSNQNKTIEIFSSDEDDVQIKEKENERPAIQIKSPSKMLQPKINHVPVLAPSRTPKQKIQYVSKDFYNKELFKLSELKSELSNAERIANRMASQLPDNGTQLKLRCDRLRADIGIKNKYIGSLKIEDAPGVRVPLSVKNQRPAENQKPFFNTNAPNWDELSEAVNQIQPTHTGARGLQTFNTQKALTVDRLKEMHTGLEKRPTEDVLADDPKGLKVSLMPHQKHALAWMTWREKQKPRGGILADDMGLGKTLTMISLVLDAKNREEQEKEDEDEKEESESEDEETAANHGWVAKGRRDYYNGGTLVICPASLIRQWESEIESKVIRHKLTVCVHHGNNRDTKPKHLRTYDVVVTTYNIVPREHKTNGALFGLKWRRIILDEAHLVRNHKAQSSMAVCALKGRYRWALTGTPIQNKEADVYALIKFLKCSPFDDLSHWKRWIDNKSAGGQMRLNTLMQSLMLRRTKTQLQTRGELSNLPEKEIKLIEVQLDKEEMNVYQKIMIYSRSLFAQYLMQRAEKNPGSMYALDGNRPTSTQTKDSTEAYYKVHQKFSKLYHGTKEIKSHEILVLLLRLRQICCHPGLIDAMLEDDDASHMESDSDNTQPEIDLLAQLEKLAIKDTSNEGSGVNSLLGNNSIEDAPRKPEEEVMAKASAKVLQRSNPVFDLSRPSTKMLLVLKTLEEYVLKSDDKAIIVSQWTSVLNILRTHLEKKGVRTLALNGTVAVKLRQDIVSEFNDPRSSKRVLLLSLTAGGVGLNLVGANHLLLIDLHWNPQLEAQAQDRIYRVGQKKNVCIYKFMCKETVEESIKALQDKKLQIANGVLTGAKPSEGSKLSIDDLKGLFGL